MTLMKMTPQGPVAMTGDEAVTFLTQQTQVSAALDQVAFRQAAADALKASDAVATRCLKAGVAYPAEWLAYDRALRAVLAAGTGPLPTRPAYPAGT